MKRAVVVNPGGRDGDRWVRACGNYASERGYKLVAIAGEVSDAMYEVVNGRADVVVVALADHLGPVVEVVQGKVDAAPAAGQRRVQRLR